MGNMFSKPKVAEMPAAAPTPAPLPIRDDEAMRKEKMKTYAAAAKRSGDESTRMTTNRMGDSSDATTRSTVLGAS